MLLNLQLKVLFFRFFFDFSLLYVVIVNERRFIACLWLVIYLWWLLRVALTFFFTNWCTTHVFNTSHLTWLSGNFYCRMARAKPRTHLFTVGWPGLSQEPTFYCRMARAKPRTQLRHFRRMARAKPRTQHRRMARAKPRTQHRRMARAKPRTQLRHFRRMARAKPRTHFVLAGAKPSTPLQGLTVAFWSVDGVCFLRFWFELLTSVLLMGFASISIAPFGGRVCENT